MKMEIPMTKKEMETIKRQQEYHENMLSKTGSNEKIHEVSRAFVRFKQINGEVKQQHFSTAA